MKTLNINELQILGAVLPSIKEIENLSQEQRKFKYWYWLRSPGITQTYAAGVRLGGSVGYYGYTVTYDDVCVRPALVIENLPDFGLKPGEKVEIEGLPKKFSKYIVLNEHMLFANFDIGFHAFNEDIIKGNDYWTSDVKEVVDKWFEQNFTEQI